MGGSADTAATTTPGGGAGPTLPGYTILRTLGQGGAAVVYLARQEALQRDVAVKMLRRDVDDPKSWRYFRREAETIARLSTHPNVVTVYTAGRSEDGHPYLVTEFLDRGSLGDVVAAGGPLPPVEVAKVGVAIADALAAAHGLGILHRDVKPGNVLLDHDGRVKLGDFGIARLLGGQSATTTDVIAFTPEHVAPEVLRGERDGPWSDVYGLASTLATAVVGSSLFAPRPGERLDAVMTRKLMAPAPVLPPTVPAALADPVTQALDPDPTRRPALDELRARLAEAVEALGSTAPAPPRVPVDATERGAVAPMAAAARDGGGPPAEPLVGPIRRRRRWWMAVPAALLAAAGAMAVAAMDDDNGGDADEASVVTSVPAAPTSSPSTVPATTATTATTAAAAIAPAATIAPTTPTPAGPTIAPTTVAPTTVAPTTVAPTTTATVPPTTAAAAVPEPTDPAAAAGPGPNEPLTAPGAEAFVRSYFDAVAAGDYEASWAQLAPEFQRGRARSYDYYVEFWNDNDVEVDAVELVESDRNRAVVDVELRWNGSRAALTDRFTLRRVGDDVFIASQESN